jgi:hypothetical protein
VSASPFLISFGALAAYKLESPPLAGAGVALKLLLIFICVQPLFILFPISASTSDTAGRRVLWWLVVFAPLMLLILGASVAVFLSRTALGAVASYGMLALLSFLAFVLYRRAYRLGKFDLIAPKNRDGRSRVLGAG